MYLPYSSPYSEFQSRAGFSECLDLKVLLDDKVLGVFQSRAGFSECLDLRQLPGDEREGHVSIPCWVF